VDLLVADPGKARKALDWQANLNLEGLIAMMVDADLKRVASEMI
jgi:GDP-D-mannose dehydratase